MKKICLALGILMIMSEVCFAAELPPGYLFDINNIRGLLVKTKKQYESRREQLKAEMPYLQVIPTREREIKKVEELLKTLGKEPLAIDTKKVIIDEVEDVFDALLVDANNEMQIVFLCNTMLEKYGSAQGTDVVRLVRDNAVLNYMMFDNISQMSMLGLLKSKGMSMEKTAQQERLRGKKKSNFSRSSL